MLFTQEKATHSSKGVLRHILFIPTTSEFYMKAMILKKIVGLHNYCGNSVMRSPISRLGSKDEEEHMKSTGVWANEWTNSWRLIYLIFIPLLHPVFKAVNS